MKLLLLVAKLTTDFCLLNKEHICFALCASCADVKEKEREKWNDYDDTKTNMYAQI